MPQSEPSQGTVKTDVCPVRTARPASVEVGYRSAVYADAFATFGLPRRLPRSGGWMLERPIRDTGHVDAMGLYPLFCCADWSAIADDLEKTCTDWVTATVVTDPLGGYDESLLHRTFDRVTPYKNHFIAEMTSPPETFVSKSHRQNARRALRKVLVEVCDDQMAYIDDWVSLYEVLAKKHGVTGYRAFSRQSFARQLCTPGMIMFRASIDGETVGLDLWYVDGEVAQGHLAAFSEKGYANSASYATKWTLLNYFSNKVRWVNFGGLADASGKGAGGLEHFKRGWSNTTRMAYICGRVFDADAYGKLTRGQGDTTFFPAYRAGEFET